MYVRIEILIDCGYAMTNLIGTITNSQGVGISGQLILTVRDAQKYSDYLISTAPAVFEIVAGVVDIEIAPVSNVRLQFIVDEVSYLDFYTDISGLTANISDLLPALPRDTLELNLMRVSAILTQIPEFLSIIKTQFNYRGTWSVGVVYSKEDFVDYAGSSYIYLHPVPSAGIPPTDNTRWQLNASIGSTVAGISGSSSPYDASWIGSTAAPSKDIIYSTLESNFAKIADYSNLATKASPAFTGTPTVPTPAITTATTQVASTAFVWDILGNIISPIDPSSPFCPDTALNDNSTRMTNNRALMAAINNLGVVKGANSFKLGNIVVCYGFYTSPLVPWTAATEQPATITLPDSISLASVLFIGAQWQGSTAATGVVNSRCNALTPTTFNLALRTAANITATIRAYWLLIGLV